MLCACKNKTMLSNQQLGGDANHATMLLYHAARPFPLAGDVPRVFGCNKYYNVCLTQHTRTRGRRGEDTTESEPLSIEYLSIVSISYLEIDREGTVK